MKEEKENEKIFWVIGIALIVFLILVFGSLIGMKIIRGKIQQVTDAEGNVVDNVYGGNTTNYEIDADGSKRNVSQGVTGAEIDVEMVRFSHFSIVEKQIGTSGDDAVTKCVFEFDMENMTAQPINNQSFIVRVLDNAGSEMITVPIMASLPVREPIHISHTREDGSFINAARVEVELQDLNS